MAVAIVQELGKQASGASLTLAFTGVTTTTGNLLMMVVALNNASASYTVSTIGDGTSNTWAKATSITEGNDDLEVWTTTNATPTGLSSATITITTTNSATRIVARFFELSGANNTSPLDKSHVASGSNTTPNSGSSGTLSNAGELCFGAISLSAGSTGLTISSLTFTQGVPTTAYPSTTGFDYD